MKKSPKTIAISIGVFLGLIFAAYAITSHFYRSDGERSDFDPGILFRHEMSNVFTEGGEILPGESKSINPVITSGATVDMYAFIRVVMPLAPSGESGLYNLNVDGSWGSESAGEVGGQWVEVYRYGEALTPGASTTPLASQITMVDMSLAEFVGLGDLNVEMTGYSCGTDDTGIDDAWSAISQYYGV